MGRMHAVDLFGPFVAPLPDVAHPGPTVRDPHAAHEAEHRTAPSDLCLEVGVAAGSAEVRRRRRVTTSCSIVVHSLGMAGVVVTPLLLSSALPEPARMVHAFFAEPLVVPPPPPPPPAPAPRAAAARTPSEVEPAPRAGFVAPVEIPNELKPEEWLDLGDDEGVGGGVEGGIPGGVVGAIVGGLPEAAVEAPTPKPVRVGGLIKEPVKVKHVDPVYPPVASAGRLQGVVILEALIDVRGRVAEIRIVRADPLFEEAAIAAVRQWVYTPTLLDGVPVRLLMTITIRFELGSLQG